MDIWETFGREAKTQRPPEVTTFFIGAKSGWFHEIYQCKEGCVFQMVSYLYTATSGNQTK